MDFLPLITIPIIFLLVAIMKPRLNKAGRNVCSICAAVLVTWVLLLVLLWMGRLNNTTPIAILMGMSVAGFMYKLADYYTKRSLKHLWIARLIVILGGFLTIMLLLARDWRAAFLSGIGSFLLLVIVTMLMQGITHRDAVESGHEGVKKSLLKKLDNCC